MSDYSVAAYNAHLERDRAFLDRLGAIDTTGLPQQAQLSKEVLVRSLVDEQEEARFKPWEMPISQIGGLHLELPQLVPQLSFETADDYDHYVTRLGKVPAAFAQITDDMMTGMDDNRVPPKYLLEKVLVQVNNLAGQKPEDSPYALPLKKFPASIPAAQQAEIRQQVLKAIATQVLPAYARFGRFLSAQYIPRGRTEPGIWSTPDGDAYYKFLVRQSTTTDMTPEQIHAIGEQQVAEDEAQMTAIAKKLGFADLKALRASIPNNREAASDLSRGADRACTAATWTGCVPSCRSSSGGCRRRLSRSRRCRITWRRTRRRRTTSTALPMGSGRASSSSTPTSTSSGC